VFQNYKSVMRSSTIAQQARREARRSSQRADNADIVFEMAMSATSIRPMHSAPMNSPPAAEHAFSG